MGDTPMLRALLVSLALVLAAAVPASADVTHAEGMATVNGFQFSWAADFDDVARTIAIQADELDLVNGSLPTPFGSRGQGGLTATLSNNQTRTFDFTPVINEGLQTFTNVNLKVLTAPRGGRGLTLSTWYRPPAR